MIISIGNYNDSQTRNELFTAIKPISINYSRDLSRSVEIVFESDLVDVVDEKCLMPYYEAIFMTNQLGKVCFKELQKKEIKPIG